MGWPGLVRPAHRRLMQIAAGVFEVGGRPPKVAMSRLSNSAIVSPVQESATETAMQGALR